mmetsp:Transcript_93847/g.180464  ORF Transcript_93847/g.180464 Transcript_93847/m.180464 type:complete len:215 (+) Transcript_93847:227-871(+)
MRLCWVINPFPFIAFISRRDRPNEFRLNRIISTYCLHRDQVHVARNIDLHPYQLISFITQSVVFGRCAILFIRFSSRLWFSGAHDLNLITKVNLITVHPWSTSSQVIDPGTHTPLAAHDTLSAWIILIRNTIQGITLSMLIRTLLAFGYERSGIFHVIWHLCFISATFCWNEVQKEARPLWMSQLFVRIWYVKEACPLWMSPLGCSLRKGRRNF